MNFGREHYTDTDPFVRLPDAYVFIRFHRLMLIILVPIWLLSWVILLPINTVGTNTNGKEGVDKLTFGNIDGDHQSRLWAHLVLAYVFSCQSILGPYDLVWGVLTFMATSLDLLQHSKRDGALGLDQAKIPDQPCPLCSSSSQHNLDHGYCPKLFGRAETRSTLPSPARRCQEDLAQ